MDCEPQDSLDHLANAPCEQVGVTGRLFRRWLWSNFRRVLAIEDTDWVASHNDLQWSNLCGPELSILDWEWFGRSPRGYDQAKLIAYSCHDHELTWGGGIRLFVSSEMSRFAKVFAAHTVRNDVLSGWLNPRC